MAGFLETLFGGGAAKESAEKNRGVYNNYAGQSYNFLDQGLGKSEGALGNAINAYQPLSALGQKYGAGTDLYLNALGVNGAAGTQAARDAFTSSPGYQFQLDQGLDALNRTAAARGMLGGGNLSQDSIKYATGLASQDYNNWLGQLGGLVNPELAATGGAASGIAGANTNLANLYNQDATNRVNVAGNQAGGLANANNFQAQGEMQGSKNLLGGLLGVGNLIFG